jgi:hypothetical protein
MDTQQFLFPHLEVALADKTFAIYRYEQADELQADSFASLLAAGVMHL